MLSVMFYMCAEFEEATDLLSADPAASTISIAAPGAAGTSSSDVRLNLSDDEENQQESSGVRFPS